MKSSLSLLNKIKYLRSSIINKIVTLKYSSSSNASNNIKYVYDDVDSITLKSEIKSEMKPESKTEIGVENKVENKTETQSEIGVENKSDNKTDSTSNNVSESKLEDKVESSNFKDTISTSTEVLSTETIKVESIATTVTTTPTETTITDNTTPPITPTDSATTSNEKAGYNYKFWAGFSIVLSGLGYWYWSYKEHDEAIDRALANVSASRSEILELQKSTEIQLSDFNKILASYIKKGVQSVNAETFANKMSTVAGDIHPNNKLTAYDLLCLYRKSEFIDHNINLPELMVGLALLVKGQEEKVQAAASAIKRDSLDEKDLISLFEKMYRTGHFSVRSLIEKVQPFPPNHGIKSFEVLAKSILEKEGKSSLTPVEVGKALRKTTKDISLIAFYLVEMPEDEKKRLEAEAKSKK